jgi:receptor-type tyrosine-protein phosphatase zeta
MEKKELCNNIIKLPAIPTPEVIYAEYREICKGEDRTKLELDQNPLHMDKNRYPDVLVIKQTAVKLDEITGVQGSGYINANFVSDKSNEKKKQLYICCQAPLSSTINDFWRMIWEQEVPVIVMITNLVEKNRVKADAYWPPKVKTVSCYGDIFVKLVSEKKKSKQNTVTIRCFQMWKVPTKSCNTTPSNNEKTSNSRDLDSEENIPTPSESINSSDDEHDIEESESEETVPQEGMEIRKVVQLHCTKWPDFGVPDSYDVLKDLISEVDIRKQEVDKPIVVHCSAGIGRTGTFVAIHMSLQKDLQGEDIDISKTVRSLREQRLGMIQSEEQYFFVYTVVHEILKDRLFRPPIKPPSLEPLRERRMSKGDFPRKKEMRESSNSSLTARNSHYLIHSENIV